MMWHSGGSGFGSIGGGGMVGAGFGSVLAQRLISGGGFYGGGVEFGFEF